eukprot:198397-Prymnesium_polylepis.2
MPHRGAHSGLSCATSRGQNKTRQVTSLGSNPCADRAQTSVLRAQRGVSSVDRRPPPTPACVPVGKGIHPVVDGV